MSPSRPRASKFRLGRLSGTWCWQLFDTLLDACSNSMSSSAIKKFRQVARNRRPADYFALDGTFGLQCIAKWHIGPPPGDPATVHMLTQLLRKSSDVELFTSSERRSQCLRKVLETDEGLPSLRKEWTTHPVYVQASKWIRGLLGPAPTDAEIAFSSRHGPGSTASLPFGMRSKYFKYSSWPYRTTPLCRNLLAYCILEDPRWGSSLEDAWRNHVQVPAWRLLNQERLLEQYVDAAYPYNIVTTVPKDGRKDRPIAKEQTGNIYLQLGVGGILRQRLRCYGIDLDRQAEINRKSALLASRLKHQFTIDLSNASDTISSALVSSLLPADWFLLLNQLRAPWGVLPDGSAFLYRKFSSMGNGFTFELETIIFLAICLGVSRTYGHESDEFQVFGDDIIGPDYLYLGVTQYLEWAGFRVNFEKSFHGTDLVRESCGVDALDGDDIRPPYVKGTPLDVMELMSIRNRLRRWFLARHGEFPTSIDRFLLSSVECSLPIGPSSDTEFDGWLHDYDGRSGVYFDALVRGVKKIPARDLFFRKLMHSLYTCTGEGGNFAVSEPSQRLRQVRRVCTWDA